MRTGSTAALSGITIVVATAEPERFRTALIMALSQVALGGRTRLFMQEQAVRLLHGDDSADYAPAGLPGRAAMLADALEAGVEIIGCQSGLALIGTQASEFDHRIAWGGMIELLQSLSDDRLIVV